MKTSNEDFIRYLTETKRSDSDFICNECGCDMLDLSDIESNFKLRHQKKDIFNRIAYSENETNAFLIRGRVINKKRYHRQICWDCFFKLRELNFDCAALSRKNKWWAERRVPLTTSSTSQSFYLIFDITKEELQAVTKSRYAYTEAKLISKHGKIEGKIKWDEYRARQGYTASSEYFKTEKNMSDEEVKAFHHSRACTKANFIKRYGKKVGTTKWKTYCDTQSYVGVKLEYYIEKYGEIEGPIKYKNMTKSKDSSSLKFFTKKYGKKIGFEKYCTKIKQFIQNTHNTTCSKISLELLNEVHLPTDILRDGLFEYIIDTGEKIYSVDFYVPHSNKIIEFYGDYWHMNPLKYEPTSYNSSVKKIANDIWEYDATRKTLIEKFGYEMLVIWEKDFNDNTSETVEKCIKFLYN